MALRIGEILVEKGFISQEDLESAINEQAKTKKILGEILVNKGLISEKKLLQVIAEQQGIPFVELKNMKIEEKAVKAVPAKFVWHYKIMPMRIEGSVLTIAISNPFDVWPIDDIETHLGLRVEKTLAVSSDILEAARKHYGVGADTIERILAQESQAPTHMPQAEESRVEDIERMSEDASVIKLVNQILQQAIKDRATDIHIEIFRDDVSMRYRVDGVLYDAQISDTMKYLYLAIVSRIKVMAGLDIVERRLPQDGRSKVRIGDKEYELRVSVMPALYGENIVVRILPTTMLFDMGKLGMSKRDLEIMEELINRPHGIIFVTGPTGSGKTTTLYSCLSRLNTRHRKIVAIEDPVEYELKGITQTQVNPKINLTFAVVLRSMLRHDPDIMMVGEVRDYETADITIQTALTGHLVFSTLHTNDAASGITRLIDIGIDPYLIASSVEAFIAQRLVRVICEKCKEIASAPAVPRNDKGEAYPRNDGEGTVPRKAPAVPRNDKGEAYPRNDGEGTVPRNDKGEALPRNDAIVYKGKGCKACNNTGYVGRTGIYEILLVSDEIKRLILEKTSSDIIKNKAIELGMRTLKQDGWEKVLAGLTTTEEVLRVTQ